MLIHELHSVGNRLYEYRKAVGMTQFEVAAAAGLSDRTYADIERGLTNMRIETLLKICEVLRITPNDVLVANKPDESIKEKTLGEITAELQNCTDKELKAASELLSVFLRFR